MGKQNEAKNYQTILKDNLIYYRKAANLTQSQLAEKFSYSDKNISKWERGESAPDIFTLKALSEFYGISVNEFFKERPKKYHEPHFKKRLITILLSVGLVWLIASIVFALLMICSQDNQSIINNSWLAFIFALLPSFIILVVFSNVYKQRFFSLLSVSGLIWCSALSIYLPWAIFAPSKYLFLIFIIPIPLQVLAVLWFLFKWSFKSFLQKIKNRLYFKSKRKQQNNE